MRIHAIEELTFGQDDVIGRTLRRGRDGVGVTIDVAAWSTGAEPWELRAVEAGELHIFSDTERLRLVLLSYCDYLGLDASPLVARLEVYSRQGLCVPPNLHSILPLEIEKSDTQRTLQVVVFAFCLTLPFYIVWSLARL